MIFLTFLNIIILLLFFFLEKKKNRDVFSPQNIFIYFSFIPAFSNFYFSINTEAFEKIVFSQVHVDFQKYILVNIALFMTIIGNLFIYLGISVGTKSSNKFFSYILNKIFINKYNSLSQNRQFNKSILKFAIISYFLGFLSFLVLVTKMGGISQIWSELHLRSSNNAGLGYFQTFYMISIQFSAMILIWYFSKYKKWKQLLITYLLTAFLVGGLGARGPVIIFIISIIIMRHYMVKRVSTILNRKTVWLIIILPFFIVTLLQLRKNSLTYFINNTEELIENSINDFESGFIARVGRLERDIVILGYFNENSFWYGKSYLGLITAPIPRTLYPEKPPVDSGMYLRAMAVGDVIEPPLPVYKLRTSSWPEHNWVGYMNYGFIGFIIFFFLSGLLFGKIYKYIKSRKFPLFPTCFYAMFAVGGAPILSPPGLVKLVTVFVVIYILLLFVFVPIRILKK
ncbi:O-antigen polysaccharide polymerase Wzy [uncultured Polaribacter sp.]|uniref:O-antigen polysaccharide polymerase Wzy n=1 Tax=uncultured Polaribacter sp. TaxID=174711 RepID=UPI002634E9A5|nr:O-antigen polysaccharide polymerase Wzy [uncultured Polaribacter sp.]